MSDNGITGNWRQSGQVLPLVLRRTEDQQK
jgi:hypothetical protein